MESRRRRGIVARVRVRTAASTSPPAALVLVRALGISLADAKQLLAIERVQPAELEVPKAEALVDALTAAGVAAQPIAVAPTRLRCQAHPQLTADDTCASCQRPCCVLCGDGARPRCARCSALGRARRRHRRARILVLSVVLVVAIAFAFSVVRQRSRRVRWIRPLQVSVVLVATRPLDAAVVEAWREGAEQLEVWFAAEGRRHGLALQQPVMVQLQPPQVREALPAPPAPAESWLAETRQSLAFRRQLDALAPASPGVDVRLVVALRPVAERERSLVEGAAEAFGSVGLVLGNDRDVSLGLELIAAAHELLHLAGAADAYDEDGHARVPEGLVEPDAEPLYPQQFGEVMVGEVPDGPGAGHVPAGLEEVRIGPATARQVKWGVP